MTTAIVVFGFVYLLIASGRIPNSLIAVIDAMAMVFSGVLTEEEAFSHVDLEVILLLAGMMSLANVGSRTGRSTWPLLEWDHAYHNLSRDNRWEAHLGQRALHPHRFIERTDMLNSRVTRRRPNAARLTRRRIPRWRPVLGQIGVDLSATCTHLVTCHGRRPALRQSVAAGQATGAYRGT